MLMNTKPNECISFFEDTYESCHAAAGGYSHYLPEEKALQNALKEAGKIGVTRLADVTGYDRVGIPIYNSIRPTTKGSSVQHGKGLTRTSSKISAVMESFERFYSVNPDLDYFEATYDEVANEMAVIPFERLLHIRGSLLRRNMPIAWTVGWDIANDRKTAAPLAMVELAGKRSQDRTFKTGHMQASSNGLSAGFHILEAISQGLLEVIERDGITCHVYKSGSMNLPFPEKKIDMNSIPYPEVHDLANIFIKAGITPFLYDCTTDIGIPVYNCFLFDNLNPEYMCVHGMGAALHSKDAMLRALTESAQSRVVFNAGSRDLFFQEDFELSLRNSSGSTFEIAKNQKQYNYDPENEMEPSLDYVKQINHCIRKLKSVNLDQVIVFRLSPDDGEVDVVRVLVPGAEGYIVSSFNPGLRALGYLKGVNK